MDWRSEHSDRKISHLLIVFQAKTPEIALVVLLSTRFKAHSWDKSL